MQMQSIIWNKNKDIFLSLPLMIMPRNFLFPGFILKGKIKITCYRQNYNGKIQQTRPNLMLDQRSDDIIK